MVKCSGDDMERSRFKSWWIDKKNKKIKFTLHKMESFPLYICKQ